MSFSFLSSPFNFLLFPVENFVFSWILHYLGPALDQGQFYYSEVDIILYSWGRHARFVPAAKKHSYN